MKQRSALPVDGILPEVVRLLRQTSSLIVEAAPGAGKTTRLPPALLDLVDGEILVLEPRRIAARLSARRVAAELGEEVGETVGYQVRFEEVSGPRTRLRFVTEGILTRRLLSDPLLRGVDAVVLDEFHERHIDGDLALALLRRLQKQRPGIRLIVMSATLEAAPLSAFLDGCPVLRSEGRVFPLTIEHLPYSPLPLQAQVSNAVEQMAAEEAGGHILVFLPGLAEIRRALRACEAACRRYGLLAMPLHGDLSPAEQDRVVAPATGRKLILATNVAESSVTIEGVNAVIDSGLARLATYSPWSGLPTLSVGRISQASAKQRAGRAGRTGPGRVLRLYAEADYRLRPAQDTPEILRSDLSQLCLALRVLGIPRVSDIDWLDAPPPAAVELAEDLLDRIGATGSMAAEIARFPLPPRLARMLVAAIERGAGDAGATAVALLASGARSEHTDLLAAIEATQDVRSLDLARQLRRLARLPKRTLPGDDDLLLSVLTGFGDRVARRRPGGQVLLSNGGSAELAGDPPAYEFLVALDIEDRTDRPLPLIRMTSRVEPEWMLDLFPERVRERIELVWNREAERVESVSALLYDELVFEESRDARPDPERAAALLAQKALEAGIERFVEAELLATFQARVAFAGLDAPDLSAALYQLCLGLRSFADLRARAAELMPLLEAAVDARMLRETAPVSIRLAGGRSAKVHYEAAKPPWIASRLQDFFGMVESPRIGAGRTPLVVHLLAPNGRAVQTTTDLRGFWERLYPEVRRELMRRYPRHSWPERP